MTSDHTRISNWGKANIVLFNAWKIQFLHLSTCITFRTICPSTLNNLGLSFIYNLNRKFDKLASEVKIIMGNSTRIILDRVESKALCLIISSPHWLSWTFFSLLQCCICCYLWLLFSCQQLFWSWSSLPITLLYKTLIPILTTYVM